jgi:2-polyprenyl-6-methoxyphenol hydroxylase-like FAD-dependent oxidoreductase
MRHITVVGGGQAGLLLAIGLRQHGHQVRLVQNRSAEQIRSGKVLSSQCVFEAARAEERALGLDLWADNAPPIAGMRVQVAAPDGSGAKVIGFEGRLSQPAQSVDQRIKFSKFLDVLAAKGGTIELRDVGVADLERYAAESDLVVVAAGKAEISQLFARDASRSPFDQPMRALALVYVHGMLPHDGPRCVTATLIPGVGELFTIPALTHSGPCDILFFEAIPGGPLDCFNDRPNVDAQLARTKEMVRRFIPWEADRVANVTPTDANASLTGRFAPAVRHPVGRLPSGARVLGLADTIALADPIVGQGSNNAIKSAWIYLEAVNTRASAPFDEAWMAATAEAAYRRVEASVQWSNMMLLPPPEHAVMLLAKAMDNPALADRIANGFDEPATILPLFADPAQAAAA